MMKTTQNGDARPMSTQDQNIRQQFLAQACHYLFGPAASCENFLRLGIPSLRPVPVSSQQHR